MKPYEVEITETLRRTVTVEAHDYDDAINKVRNAWRRSEYVLDANYFLEAEFEIVRFKHSQSIQLWACNHRKENTHEHNQLCT